MRTFESSAFWEGGETAWWIGLRTAIESAKSRLAKAQSEEERSEARAELDRLNEQHADAVENGHRRLY